MYMAFRLLYDDHRQINIQDAWYFYCLSFRASVDVRWFVAFEVCCAFLTSKCDRSSLEKALQPCNSTKRILINLPKLLAMYSIKQILNSCIEDLLHLEFFVPIYVAY